MAPKRVGRRWGSSSAPLVTSDPSPTAESYSLSTNNNPLLWEVEEYIPDPWDDEDSVDRLVEGEEEEEEEADASTSGASSDFLVGGGVSGYSGQYLGIPVATMEQDAKW